MFRTDNGGSRLFGEETTGIDTYPPISRAMIIPWLTILGSAAMVLGALLMVGIGTRRA